MRGDGNLRENELGEIPPLGCAVCSYGDWGFYLTLLYFSMVVPYAYLGFKATNKSKRKFAMYDGFLNHFDKKNSFH